MCDQPDVLPLLTIELLATVFSAFAPVTKIVAATQVDGSLHCWIQCTDPDAASKVRREAACLLILLWGRDEERVGQEEGRWRRKS